MRRPSVPIGIGLLAAVLALGAVGCGKEEAPRNETRIQRASRLLNSGTVRQRQAAAAALGDMQGSESADLLLKALADPHVNVKRSAAAALLKRDDPRAALRAASLIDHNDAGLRTLAVSLAKRFPHPSLVEPLAGRLKDPQMLIRAEAADALSRIGEPAVEALIEQAGSGDPKAQREAARALGQIGKHRAAAALANLLDSPDTDVRLQAAAALGLVGDPRGVPALKRIVTDPLTDAEKQRFARRLGAAPSPL
ncbi:MAG: HEAT repeat domain-containing protein, partial [Phycisphaerae bacterium]